MNLLSLTALAVNSLRSLRPGTAPGTAQGPTSGAQLSPSAVEKNARDGGSTAGAAEGRMLWCDSGSPIHDPNP